jgi:Uma2 family endonuclease
LTAASDDGIVVDMEKRISTDDYFRRPETNRPAELAYGVVREPPTPFYGHQHVVGQLFLLLKSHVAKHRLGDVCISPMDVVLDKDAGLIVQPDIMFISNERSSIIQNHVWGAPDLVVEVASPTTEYRDRTIKLAWYRKYGVRESWLVNPKREQVTVVDCVSGAEETFSGSGPVRSRVLQELSITAAQCFE